MAESECDGRWAVCPKTDDTSDKLPLVFDTIAEANNFLGSEVALQPAQEEADLLGVRVSEVEDTRYAFDEARFEWERKLARGEVSAVEIPSQFWRRYNRDQGWLKPVPVKNPTTGIPSLWFDEFLPLEAIGTPVRENIDNIIERVFDDRYPHFSCCLSEIWRFEEIELDMKWRPGHEFDGRKHRNIAEIAWKAVHDFRAVLERVHPGISATSKADFFTSWQLWRHLHEFCMRVSKSSTAEKLTGHSWKAKEESDNACDFFYKEFRLYAHAISPSLAPHDQTPVPGAASDRSPDNFTASAFWVNLARRFRQIDPYELLSLDWQLSDQDRSPGSTGWGISGAGESIQRHFLKLSAEAGRQLRPDDPHPSDVWFTLLKDSVRKLPYRLEAHNKRWILRRACEMSAQLCALQDPNSEKLPFPEVSQSRGTDSSKPAVSGKPARLPRTISSMPAARRLEKYLEATGIGVTEFAGLAETTDRTLRNFRRTGKVERGIFDSIAKAMGVTRDDLLKPET